MTVALPKESYCVGNYQGYDDSEFHWFTPKKTGSHVTIGSLVQIAKTYAAQHGVPFPPELGRPGVREDLHRSGIQFGNHSEVSGPDDTRGAVPKPDGLFDGPEYADRPEPQWLIPGITMEAGYTIASGRSQAGKSFCELAQALSIATGKPWLGEPIEKTGPVLYIAAEGQGRIWNDVRAWCAEFDLDPETMRGRFFIYDRSARLNTEAGARALTDILAYIKDVTGRLPILAVFDTLRRNMRGGVSQEEPTSEVLYAVNDLQAEGIAVTLVAHLGRGHGETKGLTEWEDDADQVRNYRGTVRDATTKIEFNKVKSSEDGWSISVEYANRQLPNGETTMVAVRGRRRDLGEQSVSKKDPTAQAMAERAAIEILQMCDAPTMHRTDLADAVSRKLNPDLEKQDPKAFARSVRTLTRKFGRGGDSQLSQYAEKRGSGKNREIHTFATHAGVPGDQL